MRKQESDKVKQLRGTGKKCRQTAKESLPAVDIAGLSTVPDAPQHLDIIAKKYWDKIAPSLVKNGILSEIDLEALEVMCILYSNVRRQSDNSLPVQASMTAQLRLYQAAFFIGPASRMKESPEVKAGMKTGEAKPGNSFANNVRNK